MIRLFITFISGLIATSALAERPNFVILVTDGIGRDWISCYGAEHTTPHLDALASEGILFTVAWGSPVSASTRATLVSGQYPFRHGILNESDQTPAQHHPLLKSLGTTGYTTSAMAGLFSPDVIEESLSEGSQPFCLYYQLAHQDNPLTDSTSFTEYVDRVDHEVGVITEILEQKGLTKNTVIIFTSNAASSFPGTLNGEAHPKSRDINANWSAHIPLIVRAPGIISEPRSRRDLIDASDIFPTVLELADIPVPDDHPVDGKSFLPVLRGIDDPFEKRNWIYAQSGNFRMMRDWHHYIDDDGNFHDLDKDPFQREEVSVQDKQAPHRRERLQMILDRLPKAED